MTPYSAPGIKRDPSVRYTMTKIANVISQHYNISIERIRDKTRKREVVVARQVCIYFMKKHTKETLKNIGIFVGGRDHTTAIHSIHTVNDLIDTDAEFKREIRLLDTFFIN
jgi:chromosomal replication initiator protein